MKIHEYQGKEILKKYGVTVPRGIPCMSVDEAVKAAETLGGPVWVVKAQIHAGGRGKGGGVKVAKSIDQVREYANQIMGMQLITHLKDIRTLRNSSNSSTTTRVSPFSPRALQNLTSNLSLLTTQVDLAQPTKAT